MCMKDGPVSLRRMPLYKRHQFLGLLQQHWAMTQASKEFSLSFNLPAIIGVSGRFVYEIQNHGLFNLLNLFELPSSTMNIIPSQLKPFQCPEIEHVAVDHIQNLIVSSHAYKYVFPAFFAPPALIYTSSQFKRPDLCQGALP